MGRASAERSSGSASEHAAGTPRNNLPTEPTSFIGRSAELARVRELLGETRLLTLVGAGGCGKTRLALQSAAAAAAELFEDGLWWVELAAVEDPGLLATTVASALGIKERPRRSPLDLLRDHIGESRTLLLLDNCEHLLDAAAALAQPLLQECPALVILCTSREALRVPGEVPYRVPSLAVPEYPAPLSAVTEADAVRLFLDRAIHVRPAFAVSEDNASFVAAICRSLDGMPLAIELAAARVRMLSPERIARELGDRFRLLTGGGRTVAPRHDTLRASIDWSHDLCSEAERVLLRRLSVWVGGFTLDGAEAVCAGEPLSGSAVLEALTGLVDKSLVDTEEHAGELRFRMLETIRQYAAGRLVEAGETVVARRHHLAWCLDLAERAEPELVRHDSRTWLSRLELEAANLRAALDWASSGEEETALRLAGALTFFWLMRGHLEEGSASLARVTDAAQQVSARRGKALWGLGELNIWRARWEPSLDAAARAVADGEAVGDRSVVARALKVRGLVLSLPDPQQRRPLERSLVLSREAGDDWCTADATRHLASCYMRQGEHESARPIIEESYALARELGYRPLYAWYFNISAKRELEHGRLRAARELADQAVVAAREVGDPVTLGFATAILVECDVLEGAPGEGRKRGEQSLEFMRTTGASPGLVWIQCALALADIWDGCPDAAYRRIEVVSPAIEAAPSHDNLARASRVLAMARLQERDLDGAGDEAQQLLAHAQSGRNEQVEGIAHHLLARVALARGAALEANDHVNAAIAITARRDFRPQTLDSLDSQAAIAAKTDSPAEGVRLLAAVSAAREASGLARWPREEEARAGIERELRGALGEDAYAAAEAEGLALSVGEAVEYASRARGKRKRPTRGWESLTPAEIEVVRHAAAGLTNPQIGERMFISRATVKAHLSHVFAKLGVTSRAELASEATQRGLEPA